MGREKEIWSGLKDRIYILILTLCISGAVNIYLAFSIVQLAKSRELSVFIPPNYSFDIGSQTYKVQSGISFIEMLSTWTSDQYVDRIGEIVTNTFPEDAPGIEKSLNEMATEIKDNNVKQSFYIDRSTVRIDRSTSEANVWRIKASGLFEQTVCGKTNTIKNYNYYVDIFYANGRVFIKRYGHGKA